ncbi:MSCRAMM family adhesin SdrC [Haloarcula salinisoli]|uniref:MSCRAMM family adhesin SdrC n=1 Tax=Haloarcula salinisoli TaxID=2487746 RepID=A0A8J7YG27_9EURY|nr:MSCRAMM family adhesin SdrC [Halomicroarcula salinisoli]MBX0302718.1 MSCRAMM family adhesin SdrC [Halomicroarcula salinisoli]
MPEITVTESQRERLEAIQEEIESAYIDTYGHIRTTDVVQYLLDTYTPPEQQGDVAHERIATAEFGALQAVATDVEGVPGSGIDAETMRGELLSTLGVGEFAARLADVEGGDAESGVEDDAAETSEADESSSETPSTAETDADDDSEPETDADDEAADETDVGEETGDETDAGEEVGDETDAGAETESDDSGGSTSTSAAANDGPGAVLSAANQLLTDHEDKWREGGSDSPYEVDLPDGTTETVRTKDDVRGLLFKHY